MVINSLKLLFACKETCFIVMAHSWNSVTVVFKYLFEITFDREINCILYLGFHRFYEGPTATYYGLL